MFKYRRLTDRFLNVQCPKCDSTDPNINNYRPLFILFIAPDGIGVQCPNCGDDWRLIIMDRGSLEFLNHELIPTVGSML